MTNVGWCAASCVLARCAQDPASCCASASPKHQTNSRLLEEPNFYLRGLPLWSKSSEVQRDRNIYLDLTLTSESEALTTQYTELSVFPANNITCIYACDVPPPPAPASGFSGSCESWLRRHRRTPSPQSKQPGGCTLYHMVGLQGT